MERQFRTLGIVLLVFSVVLLLILTFVKVSVDKQSAVLCDKFHEDNIPMEQCPVHKSSLSWMIVSAFGIGFLLLGIGGYLMFFLKRTPVAVMDSTPLPDTEKRFRQVDLSSFDEEEKKIYDLIKGKEGSAYQSDLIKEAGFSKVKITRVLDKLETKHVLERKRRGMTNIVVLK